MKNLSKNFHLIIAVLFLVQIYFDYETHLETKNTAEQQLNGLKGKILTSKRKLKELKSFVTNLEESKKRVQEVAQQIMTVQRQLPTAISDTEVLDFISQESGKINIKDMVLTPKEEELNGFYFAKKYNFDGQGTFLQFVVLFERIYNAERLFNIDKVTFSQKGNEFQKGRFHLVEMSTQIESYRYNSDYQENTGIEEIEKKYLKPTIPNKNSKRGKR